MIQLRIKDLLEPIGVPAHYIVPEKEKNDFFIAASEEDEMIGCCVLTPKENGLIQLRQMAVRPDQQGKRIGAAIIQFAEETARENGFTTLMMHARNPVIDFYKKCGYQISGAEFFEVGIGHHKMQKNLQG
jgi:N-acetylglutamate synthase-like GNAT family acetyltransferase